MKQIYREIAENSGFLLWGNESWNPGDVIDWSSRYDEELERFAEAIVQRCIGVLETRKDSPIIVNAIKEMKENFNIGE